MISLSIPVWGIEAMTGYTPKTTFWQDFSIADKFGPRAVKDTFNRAFREWRTDAVYLTELVLVLNHKIWQHYDSKKPANHPTNVLAKLYDEIWRKANDYALDHLKGDDLDYFYTATD